MTIFQYTTSMVPRSIDVNKMNTMSDQEIVTKLKVNNLFLKIINFYAQLKMANQRVSEGKESCPVRISWEPQKNAKISPIACLQVRYLLSVINVTNPFGRVLELSARYLQDLKFYNNSLKTGFSYKRKFS